MNFINKIEDIINRFLMFLGQLPLLLYNKYTPEAKKEKVSKFFGSIKEKPAKLKAFFLGLVKDWRGTLQKIIAFFAHISHELQPRLKKIQDATKKINQSHFKPTEIAKKSVEVFHNFSQKLDAWVKNAKPETILAFFVTLTIGLLAMASVFKSARRMVLKQMPVEEVQVDPSTQVKRRPAYHQLEKRLVWVANVNVPFSFENGVVDKEAEGVKSLIIDIYVETSNRYLAIYLMENEHILKDFLNKNFQPMIPTFPLTEEGKAVIREHLINILNKLLQDKKAKGEIKNVFIINITVS